MAKGQKRSNREKKKPKAAAKVAAPVAVEPRSFKYDPARIGAKRV